MNIFFVHIHFLIGHIPRYAPSSKMNLSSKILFILFMVLFVGYILQYAPSSKMNLTSKILIKLFF